MQSSSTILLGAVTLGFIGGSIPGPVLTSIFTEIIETGFSRALLVLLSAMLVETGVRLFALFIAGVLPPDGAIFQALSFLGALILLHIARKVWRIRGMAASGASFRFGTLALMIICNGMLWTYWLTVCVPDALRLAEDLPYGQYLYLFIFECGWCLSTFLMASIFACFKSFLSHPRIMPLLFKFFALVFVGFALKMMMGSLMFLQQTVL